MAIPARLKRLYNELEQMNELHQRNGLIHVVAAHGDPPERYVVGFRCQGVARLENDRPVLSDEHRAEIALTVEYPLVRPLVRWMTPIFHPNFIRGEVCTNEWYPQQTLRTFCVVLAEMVQYKVYDTTSPLDIDAAMWAMHHRDELPVDTRDVTAPAQGQPTPTPMARSAYRASVVVVGTVPIVPQPAQPQPVQPSSVSAAVPARFCRKCRFEFTDPEMRFCPQCGTPRRMS